MCDFDRKSYLNLAFPLGWRGHVDKHDIQFRRVLSRDPFIMFERFV